MSCLIRIYTVCRTSVLVCRDERVKVKATNKALNPRITSHNSNGQHSKKKKKSLLFRRNEPANEKKRTLWFPDCDSSNAHVQLPVRAADMHFLPEAF